MLRQMKPRADLERITHESPYLDVRSWSPRANVVGGARRPTRDVNRVVSGAQLFSLGRPGSLAQFAELNCALHAVLAVDLPAVG